MPGDSRGLCGGCTLPRPAQYLPPTASHLPLPEVFSCAHTSPPERVCLLGCRAGGCEPQPRSGVCREARLPLGSPDGESHISSRTT